MFTRRLWMAIGLHIAWNFVQGGIYGVAVSGIPVTGLLRSTLDGPELITGGRFGAEASIFAVLVCLAASVFFLRKAQQKREFVKPMWSRRA
jgi:membrane associated rhomboid family serine protease